MRWIYSFIFIFFIFTVCSIKSDDMDLIDDDSYGLYTLSLEGVNSNNFLDYFSGMRVMRIYPCVNPIYRNNIGYIFYDVGGMNLRYSLENFRENYLYLVKKNSYMDYNYLYVNGIKIDKVDVYLSDVQLRQFINSSDLVVNIIK